MVEREERRSRATCVAASRRTSRLRTDRVLFARCDAGDERARDELIERFLPLARSVARRYERRGEPLDDLVQVACLALVKAVDRFDVRRGYAFTSFAVPTIVGELKRYFRDRTWSVRPPREVQELTLRVEAAAVRLAQTLDRAPTVGELAEATGGSYEHVLEAIHARGARSALSLEGPAAEHDDQQALQETLGASDDGYELAEHRVVLDGLLDYLSPREREVVRLRFERDLTQREIGELLGISQMQVSRIARNSITRLRRVAEQQRRLQGAAAHASH